MCIFKVLVHSNLACRSQNMGTVINYYAVTSHCVVQYDTHIHPWWLLSSWNEVRLTEELNLNFNWPVVGLKSRQPPVTSECCETETFPLHSAFYTGVKWAVCQSILPTGCTAHLSDTGVHKHGSRSFCRESNSTAKSCNQQGWGSRPHNLLRAQNGPNHNLFIPENRDPKILSAQVPFCFCSSFLF